MGSSPAALPLEIRALLTGLTGATVADDQQWILALLQRHGASVVCLLWRMLGCEHEVLDCYQAAVCQLTASGKDAVRSNPGGYFYRIAMNAAIGVLRNRRQERQHHPQMADLKERRDSDQAASLAADRMFDRRVVLDRMREAIFQLPPQLRDVIVLRDLAEMPYTRVAEILGIGVRTARLYRCQAIARLAELIGQETIS